MEIILHTQPAPTIDSAIQSDLAGMDPPVFMLWNPRYGRSSRVDANGKPIWDARWEIWVRLQHVPGAKNDLYTTKHRGVQHPDRWNSDAQCWMRYLQVYETADGKFAPADRALVLGLEMADTSRDRFFYEKYIEDPHNQAEQAQIRAIREPAIGSANYYRHFNRTLVGPAGSGDWRWRHR